MKKSNQTYKKRPWEYYEVLGKAETTSAPSSFGWVDGDFDRLEATEVEYAERLRTRGTF